MAHRPLFIFGHSTGHSGTGTFHQSIIQPGCPWSAVVDEFEYLADGEKTWPYDAECSLVQKKLIQHLYSVVANKTTVGLGHGVAYVDLGHFHNRGRTLECLATHLKENSIFIHIRRNRYSIARSFTDSMTRLTNSDPKTKITPCMSRIVIEGQEFAHPHVSICPRSTENSGRVDLPVPNDTVWDSLTSFQQFLWYADEMEHRWHSLLMMFNSSNGAISSALPQHVPGTSGKPTFIEVTWNNEKELESGVNWVRKQLGCSPVKALVNQHPHVKHKGGMLNCSRYLWEDFQYRTVMNFNAKKNDILFSNAPQYLGGEECSETKSELEQKIREFSLLFRLEFNSIFSDGNM
ncbi:hypothetical protein ACHAWX_001396 [Stephanocyclus meneghinianus]